MSPPWINVFIARPPAASSHSRGPLVQATPISDDSPMPTPTATVIRNATIVTGDAGRTVLHDGAIALAAVRIGALGPSADVDRRFPAAETIDGRGKAVFPGFVNCHTHLWFTVARGIQEDFGFPSTLRFPTTAQAMLSA